MTTVYGKTYNGLPHQLVIQKHFFVYRMIVVIDRQTI